MRKIIDLHLHSKYSRATSKFFDLVEIAKWSKIKGVDIVACPDFTHPKWFQEIKNNLQETEKDSGLFYLKNDQSGVKFLLATEVACIYRQNDKTRRVHLSILMPSLESVEKFNQALVSRGAKLTSDGRPILGMSAKQVLEIMLEVDEQAMMIPAHVWTPWFALFGSKSGFDSLEECFEDLSPYIKSLETGLSSDPLMNWHWQALDKYTLVSNSDAHSGPNIGREANVVDLKTETYQEIVEIIKNKDRNKFLYTIEFFPENGMYHWDGHRDCKFSCNPEQSKKYQNICPKCHKTLTLGVEYQVKKLANRKTATAEWGPAKGGKEITQNNHIPYKSIVPLPEIIADYLQVNKTSKKVESLFFEIISKSKNEFEVLLDLDLQALNKIMPANLAKGIIKVRSGEIKLIPGFDGQYGKTEIFSLQEQYETQKLF